jgi:hypothetical protein
MADLNVNSIGDASGGNTATINGYAPTLSNMAGRNRIINGDMRIDQRNAGASVSVASGSAFITDRFNFTVIAGSPVMSGQQVTDAPSNYKNSFKATTTTAASSLTGSNRAVFQQNIEGLNVADLGWGTASASTITLSFWVKSSLTGTFGGALQNSDLSRSYPFTYGISTANTWTQITLTIAGDTSGTWLTTNGIGIQVIFGLGVAPDFSGTAGAWSSADYRSATSAVSVISTLNATWQITGVQLEVGSVATPFEHRQYGQELALCQRYYQIFKHRIEDDSASTSKIFFGGASFPTQMRATPTATTTYTNSGVVDTGEIHFRYRENYSFLQGIRETGSGTAFADITNTFSAEL